MFTIATFCLCYCYSFLLMQIRLPVPIQLNLVLTFHYDRDRFKLYQYFAGRHHHHDSKLRKVNLITGRSRLVIMQFNANGVMAWTEMLRRHNTRKMMPAWPILEPAGFLSRQFLGVSQLCQRIGQPPIKSPSSCHSLGWPGVDWGVLDGLLSVRGKNSDKKQSWLLMCECSWNL